jgi:serine/threonine protein kinase
MDTERWRRLRGLFDAALELDASERPAFVARSCAGDSELQRTLESLLEHSRETGSVFDQALIESVDLEGSIPTELDLRDRTLGRYRIIEKIGEGGTGEVYRATDSRLGRDVAIKILPEVFTRDPERLARFEREAQVLASLSHPNIATIHGLEEAGCTRYLVLELVDGVTLRSKLVQGALPIKTVVRLAGQIAEGLAKAHHAGIVHRDLKPENLMLTGDGFVKILDFGLAKAALERADRGSVVPAEPDVKTETGRIMGTVSYMSPEQARGEQVDHRSDQFAFGSVLYEMVSGTRAFGGPTDADVWPRTARNATIRPAIWRVTSATCPSDSERSTTPPSLRARPAAARPRQGTDGRPWNAGNDVAQLSAPRIESTWMGWSIGSSSRRPPSSTSGGRPSSTPISSNRDCIRSMH